MSENVKLKDQKIVCIKSGNRCALSDCRREIVLDGNSGDPSVIIGELAHIKGEKPSAKRYDQSMTDIQRNGHENLILLCPNLNL